MTNYHQIQRWLILPNRKIHRNLNNKRLTHKPRKLMIKWLMHSKNMILPWLSCISSLLSLLSRCSCFTAGSKSASWRNRLCRKKMEIKLSMSMDASMAYRSGLKSQRTLSRSPNRCQVFRGMEPKT